LAVQDPTAYNTKILVTIQLNEAGTAYCRATRSDSGETSADMPINRILTSNWSGAFIGSGTVTIEMTKLENIDPSLTNRDDHDVNFVESVQYDIYCLARDDAIDGVGNSRPNYMTQGYIQSNVNSASSPAGGRTPSVWVVDVTPPSMIHVH